MSGYIKIGLVIVAIVALFLVVPFLITLVWGWVVPDVFSGMVNKELLPASLTYLQAVKILVLLAILGLTTRGGKS